MENGFSSISKQRHVRYTDDYFKSLDVPKGFSVPKTKESGIIACMVDPALPAEKDFQQFTTTNHQFSSINSSGSGDTKTPKPQEPKDIPQTQVYGLLNGKGTKKTRA